MFFLGFLIDDENYIAISINATTANPAFSPEIVQDVDTYRVVPWWCPSSLAKLVYNSTFTTVYGRYIYIYTGGTDVFPTKLVLGESRHLFCNASTKKNLPVDSVLVRDGAICLYICIYIYTYYYG